MHRKSILVLLGVMGFGGACAAQAGPIYSKQGSVFNPEAAETVLPATTVSNGQSITFNTTDLTVSGVVSGSGETARNKNWTATTGVELAMFTFDYLDIQSGATVTVTGNRGLVLASRSDLKFGATLNLHGQTSSRVKQNSGASYGGDGGPGAEGGVRTVGFNSTPPPSNKGKGGRWGVPAGIGFGGGSSTSQVGGGGGYGGMGGTAWYGSLAGATYGDAPINILYGGSGGGGSVVNDYCYGGGGGGSVELTARGTLTLSGTINVRGGHGDTTDGVDCSGGSGGGVILAARTLTVSGMIYANGGDAARTWQGYAAAGGGGGRVAWYYRQKIAGTASNVNVSKGYNNGDVSPENGTFWEGELKVPTATQLYFQ